MPHQVSAYREKQWKRTDYEVSMMDLNCSDIFARGSAAGRRIGRPEETSTRTAGDGVSKEQTPWQHCSLASLNPQLPTGPRPTAHSTVHGADHRLSLETSIGIEKAETVWIHPSTTMKLSYKPVGYCPRGHKESDTTRGLDNRRKLERSTNTRKQ